MVAKKKALSKSKPKTSKTTVKSPKTSAPRTTRAKKTAKK